MCQRVEFALLKQDCSLHSFCLCLASSNSSIVLFEKTHDSTTDSFFVLPSNQWSAIITFSYGSAHPGTRKWNTPPPQRTRPHSHVRTRGLHEVWVGVVGDEGDGQLSEVQLQSPRDDVDVLVHVGRDVRPLSVWGAGSDRGHSLFALSHESGTNALFLRDGIWAGNWVHHQL